MGLRIWTIENNSGQDRFLVSMYKPGVPNRGDTLSIDGVTEEELLELRDEITAKFGE